MNPSFSDLWHLLLRRTKLYTACGESAQPVYIFCPRFSDLHFALSSLLFTHQKRPITCQSPSGMNLGCCQAAGGKAQAAAPQQSHSASIAQQQQCQKHQGRAKNQKVIFQSAFCTGHCYSVSVHSKMEIHNCNSLHCREMEFLKRSYFTHSQLPEFLINAFLDIFLTQSKKCNSSKTLQDKLTYKSFDFHPRRNLFSFGLNSFKIPDMINTVK